MITLYIIRMTNPFTFTDTIEVYNWDYYFENIKEKGLVFPLLESGMYDDATRKMHEADITKCYTCKHFLPITSKVVGRRYCLFPYRGAILIPKEYLSNILLPNKMTEITGTWTIHYQGGGDIGFYYLRTQNDFSNLLKNSNPLIKMPALMIHGPWSGGFIEENVKYVIS
jgi:hypothetical protein